MVRDVRESLSKTFLFRYLDSSRIEEIVGFSEVVEFQPDQAIIREGEISPYVYLVLRGQVGVSVQENDGKDVYLCTIGEGEIFGEAGIFVKTPRTANVISMDKSKILRIHRSDFLQFIKREPASGIKILLIVIYGLLKKLRESNQELAFERKSDVGQDDIDSLVASIMNE